MKIHELKLSLEFCEDVYNNRKTFEIRLNDRDYRVGDIIRFVPYDMVYQKVSEHPIENVTYEIKYILSGWGIKDGYVVMSISPIN